MFALEKDCEKDFVFNDRNGTTKEERFRHLFSLWPEDYQKGVSILYATSGTE